MYRCVNCGDEVKYLFKRYSPTVLKLEQCGACRGVADKYLEYDLVVVMIDLVLLNRKAYRHILFNSSFENHWKLAVVLLLVEICTEWNSVKYGSKDHKTHFEILDFESAFYLSCMKTVIGVLLWWLCIVSFSIYVCGMPCKDMKKLWKAMTLASCSNFLIISQLIWGEVNSPLHASLVTAYTMISQTQAFCVVSESSRLRAAVGVFLATLCKITFLHKLQILTS